MQIDLLQIAQVGAGVVAAATTVAGFVSGPGALRARLDSDVALLEKLPADSAAHANLLTHIDYQVGVIAELDRNAKRDINGAITSAILIIGFGALGFWLLSLEDWWWRLGGGVVLIFAAVGLSTMYEDLQRVPRDEKGKRI